MLGEVQLGDMQGRDKTHKDMSWKEARRVHRGAVIVLPFLVVHL